MPNFMDPKYISSKGQAAFTMSPLHTFFLESSTEFPSRIF